MSDPDFFWVVNGSPEVYHVDRECCHLTHSDICTLRASVARAWDTRDECDACFPTYTTTLVGHCGCGRPVTVGSRDVLTRAQEDMGLSPTKTEEYLKKLMNQGKIYESGSDAYLTT